MTCPDPHGATPGRSPASGPCPDPGATPGRSPASGTYLDHNATTPLDPRVLEAMLPYLGAHYGNPSSRHRFGRLARGAVEAAREQVAELVGAHPGQVVFTSGGTEGNALALRGVPGALGGGAVAVSAVEHASVRETARRLVGRDHPVHVLPVDAEGRVDPEAVDRLPREVCLVSVMAANNETGVLQDLAALAGRVRDRGALCHTDAVQAAGKVPLDFAGLGVHLMTLSAHKIHGPKGVGALLVDRAVDLLPQQLGGVHEQGLRAGTENVAGIVGFGLAAELARTELAQRTERMVHLRACLEEGLAQVPGLRVFGAGAPRLPNTVMFAVPGREGETLVMALDRAGIAVSSGSACNTYGASPVLVAMGVDPDLARGAVRVSLGKDTTETEVGHLVRVLLRELSPLGNGTPGAAASGWPGPARHAADY